MWTIIGIIVGFSALFVVSNLALGGSLCTMWFKKENPIVTELIKQRGATRIKEFEKGNDLFYTFKDAEGTIRLMKVDYLNKQKNKFKLIEIQK